MFRSCYVIWNLKKSEHFLQVSIESAQVRSVSLNFEVEVDESKYPIQILIPLLFMLAKFNICSNINL